jgi:hypothetical protein
MRLVLLHYLDERSVAAAFYHSRFAAGNPLDFARPSTAPYLGVSFSSLLVGGVLGPILAVPLSVRT